MRPAVLKCEGHSRATLGSWPRESGVYSSRKEEVKMSVCTFLSVLILGILLDMWSQDCVGRVVM